MPTMLYSTFSRPAALTFGGASTDNVNCGTAADITGFTRFSFGALLKPTTFAVGNQVVSKDNVTSSRGWNLELLDTAGNMDFFWFGGTSLQYNTSGNPLVLNRWQFVAVTVDTSLGAGLKAHIYVSANQNSQLLEVAYGTKTERVTPAADTTADPLTWGNVTPGTHIWQGQLALGWFAPGLVYSLQDLQRWQREPFRMLMGMTVFTVFDSTVNKLRDRTGLGHDGTVT